MDSWLNSDTFRPPWLVCTSKMAIFRLSKNGKWQRQLANMAMYYLVNFWPTDKILGSKSIRIQPGIHFWGLESPKIKFRVLKRTFSISDVFISIFPSISELSLKQVPQAFGTIWGQSVTIQLNYGSVLRSWGGGRSEIKYHPTLWTP